MSKQDGNKLVPIAQEILKGSNIKFYGEYDIYIPMEIRFNLTECDLKCEPVAIDLQSKNNVKTLNRFNVLCYEIVGNYVIIGLNRRFDL